MLSFPCTAIANKHAYASVQVRLSLKAALEKDEIQSQGDTEAPTLVVIVPALPRAALVRRLSRCYITMKVEWQFLGSKSAGATEALPSATLTRAGRHAFALIVSGTRNSTRGAYPQTALRRTRRA
jgi:hypothetical protein